MKLALIRRQFAATGGAELYLQRLMRSLAAGGHEVHLFAEKWEGQPDGVKLHAVPVSGQRAVLPLRFAEAVLAELAKHKFDCVFSLERTLRQDVYRAGDGVHRMWLARRWKFLPWWKRVFLKRDAFHRNMTALEARTFSATHTRRVIVNSEMVSREIQQCFGFPSARIHLIRNGVDTARLTSGDREATRKKFGVAEDEFLLLFAGSGWERKGLPHLLKAMKSVSAGVRLLVAGKGDAPSGAPRNVIFAGPVSDMENAYAAADLLVMPPLYEPCANAVCEALAVGLPAVTTAQNGASELIQDGANGSVIESADKTADLVAAIELWKGRPKRRVFTTSDLSIERNVRETLLVLETAARERAAG